MRGKRIPVTPVTLDEYRRMTGDERETICDITHVLIAERIVIPTPEELARVFEPQKNQIKEVCVYLDGQEPFYLKGDINYRDLFSKVINYARLVVNYKSVKCNRLGRRLNFGDSLTFRGEEEGLVFAGFSVCRRNYGMYSFDPKVPCIDKIMGFMEMSFLRDISM